MGAKLRVVHPSYEQVCERCRGLQNRVRHLEAMLYAREVAKGAHFENKQLDNACRKHIEVKMAAEALSVAVTRFVEVMSELKD